MFRASALSITARTSSLVTIRSFYAGSTSRQEQRQSSDGSHTPADTGAATAEVPQISSQEQTAVPEPSSSGPSTSQQAVPPPNLDAIKQRLREWSEQTAVVIRNRADDFTLRSKTTFSQLGAHLNKVTGYEEIEALKRRVVEQGARAYITIISVFCLAKTYTDWGVPSMLLYSTRHDMQKPKSWQPARPRETPKWRTSNP